MLGVDVVGDNTADELLGPKKRKGGKKVSKIDSDCKAEDEDEEELPAWQDQPSIPEFHADTVIIGGSSSSSGRYAWFFGSCQRRQSSGGGWYHSRGKRESVSQQRSMEIDEHSGNAE